jgi:hypothetical protein
MNNQLEMRHTWWYAEYLDEVMQSTGNHLKEAVDMRWRWDGVRGVVRAAGTVWQTVKGSTAVDAAPLPPPERKV